MKIAEFGGVGKYAYEYSIDTVVGWLEGIIERESEACESSTSIHRAERLDQAYDALQLLHEVCEWSPSPDQATQQEARRFFATLRAA